MSYDRKGIILFGLLAELIRENENLHLLLYQ